MWGWGVLPSRRLLGRRVGLGLGQIGGRSGGGFVLFGRLGRDWGDWLGGRLCDGVAGIVGGKNQGICYGWSRGFPERWVPPCLVDRLILREDEPAIQDSTDRS